MLAMIVGRYLMLLIFLMQWLWGPPFTYADLRNGGEEALTKREREVILRGVDSLCGDTWCEGSFEFEFHTFLCLFEVNKCWLGFRYIDIYDYKNGEISYRYHSYQYKRRSVGLESLCVIEVSTRRDLFGDYEGVSSYLYDQVTACIGKKEGVEKPFKLP